MKFLLDKYIAGLCFYRTAFPVQKSGLKSSAFRSKSFPQISSESYRHNAVSNRFSSHLSTSPTNAATFVSRGCGGYTLGFAQRIAHNGSHAETWGFTLAIGGAFRSHSHIEAMKSRRKRMHALWRVSASYGAAAPLGCAASSAIWRCCFFSLCVRYFLHVRGKGGITTLGVLYMSSKRPMPACQNG